MDLSKDVLAFARENRRMCESYGYSCKECALAEYDCNLGVRDESNDIRILNEVQKWHDAHPQRTYLMDFLEKFPNCEKDEEGLPMACRKNIYHSTSRGKCCGLSCSECWNEVMEDDRS